MLRDKKRTRSDNYPKRKNTDHYKYAFPFL